MVQVTSKANVPATTTSRIHSMEFRLAVLIIDTNEFEKVALPAKGMEESADSVVSVNVFIGCVSLTSFSCSVPKYFKNYVYYPLVPS